MNFSSLLSGNKQSMDLLFMIIIYNRIDWIVCNLILPADPPQYSQTREKDTPYALTRNAMGLTVDASIFLKRTSGNKPLKWGQINPSGAEALHCIGT